MIYANEVLTEVVQRGVRRELTAVGKVGLGIDCRVISRILAKYLRQIYFRIRTIAGGINCTYTARYGIRIKRRPPGDATCRRA